MNNPSSRPRAILLALPELVPVQIDAAYWSLYFDEISYLEIFPLKELSRELHWPLERLARSTSELRLEPQPAASTNVEGGLLPQLFWTNLKQYLAWAESLGPGGLLAAASIDESSVRLPRLNKLVDALKHYPPAPSEPAQEPSGDRPDKELRLLAIWLLSVLNRQSLNNTLNTISLMENRLWAQLRGESEDGPNSAGPAWARSEKLPPGLATKVLTSWFQLALKVEGPISALLIRDPVFGEALTTLVPAPVFLAEVRPGQGNLASALAWLSSAGPDRTLDELRSGLDNRLTTALKDHHFARECSALKIYFWPGPEKSPGGFGQGQTRIPVALAMAK